MNLETKSSSTEKHILDGYSQHDLHYALRDVLHPKDQ